PLVEDAASRVSAAEALLRWESPELGSVSPAEFVPLAEEAALMVGIGSWVLRTAWRQVKAWQEQGLPPTRIAVNVSLCQLVRGDLAQLVREVLDETGIDPSLLELELSERGVLRNDPDILRRNGCSEYQGFLFSPAVPPEAYAQMLRRGLGAGLAS